MMMVSVLFRFSTQITSVHRVLCNFLHPPPPSLFWLVATHSTLLYYKNKSFYLSFLHVFFPVHSPLCEPVSPQALIARFHSCCIQVSVHPFYLFYFFFSFFLLFSPFATPALLFVAVVTGQPWLLHTRPNPSPRPSAFWRAPPKSGACTPSSGRRLFFSPNNEMNLCKAANLKQKKYIFSFSVLCRNKETSRDEFIFYSKRLMRLLIERALSFLPSQVPNTKINEFIGVHDVCVRVMQMDILENKENIMIQLESNKKADL